MEFNTRNGQFSYLSYETHSFTHPLLTIPFFSSLFPLQVIIFSLHQRMKNVLEILRGITLDVRHRKIRLRSLVLELEGDLYRSCHPACHFPDEDTVTQEDHS